ncbi:Zn-dependent hydrolase [Leptolyngbya ohadii]|uniref:Zn-dependent hydrolase n=1 Tax=Leptolyngbya ohadii TaxID=1962290 RepID=UPI000B59CE25|nr:Zn-dependent hydrolase [Leptolyngbya ohadii]
MVNATSQLQVNGDRLNESIDRLAKIGRQPNGDICRLAFTNEDLQARYRVQQWMTDAGMTVRIDAAGNLIGRYAGMNDAAPALATGSHIDTVPSGGCYDGTLGVLAGIEIVRVLRENQMRLHHPIEVIVFTDEESTMIGSRAMAGKAVLSPESYQTATGISIQEALEAIGGNWDQLTQAKRSDLAAFVELHVEQGAVLERSHKEIGVVQGVVGMHRYKVIITGQPNHAGTTPMNMRQDALIAAAHLTLAVQRIALAMPSQPVGTVGYLKVEPNAVNIVPGRVELSIDLRDLSSEVLETMMSQIRQEMETIAAQTDTQMEIEPILEVEPALASDAIQQTIAQICEEMNLSYCSLPSRAGHDAMKMARITNMGMIFVPSQEGVSHSGTEYTSPEQCVAGANVLLQALLRLDDFYRSPLPERSSPKATNRETKDFFETVPAVSRNTLSP